MLSGLFFLLLRHYRPARESEMIESILLPKHTHFCSNDNFLSTKIEQLSTNAMVTSVPQHHKERKRHVHNQRQVTHTDVTNYRHSFISCGSRSAIVFRAGGESPPTFGPTWRLLRAMGVLDSRWPPAVTSWRDCSGKAGNVT